MRREGAETGPDQAGAEIVLDLRALSHPDVSTVDALARLHLSARRSGASTRLTHVSPALRELLRLTGLAEIFDGPKPQA